MKLKFKTNNKYAAENFSDWIVPTNSTHPDWFSVLPSNKFNVKEYASRLYDKYVLGVTHPHTMNARTCSGIVDLFNNSILIKCPVDVAVQIKNGGLVWETANAAAGLHIDVPSKEQTGTFLSDRHVINAKFSTPFYLETDGGVLNTVMLHPSYHVDNTGLGGMLALPGAPRFSKKFRLNLGVMNLFSDKDDSFIIPCGHPLALLKFDQKVDVSVEYDADLIQSLPRKRFVNISEFNKDLKEESKCPFHSLWSKK